MFCFVCSVGPTWLCYGRRAYCWWACTAAACCTWPPPPSWPRSRPFSTPSSSLFSACSSLSTTVSSIPVVRLLTGKISWASLRYRYLSGSGWHGNFLASWSEHGLKRICQKLLYKIPHRWKVLWIRDIFWYRSGAADPYHWFTDPVSDQAPAPYLDPAFVVSGWQDANKK